MTSQEIKHTPEDARSVVGWLKEIAYQLAVSNERILPVVDRNKPIYERKAKQ